MTGALKVLVVDDEQFARTRIKQLLEDCNDKLAVSCIGEAGTAEEAQALLTKQRMDVVLLDINMPGMGGVELAKWIKQLPESPNIIFTTAHDEFALQAFDLAATDYILKPVRLERLLEALGRVKPTKKPAPVLDQEAFISVSERGRIILVPIGDVLYLKAELKYITIVTKEKEYLLEGALTQLEQDYSAHFVRIHRNCLVHTDQLSGFERSTVADEEPHWLAVLKCGVKLPVSRRQWQQLRGVIK